MDLPVNGAVSSSAIGNFQPLASKLQGKIILPGDVDYDESRKIWNSMIDKKPALIVQCRSSNDIIEAVRFARKNNFLVSIRGGGHNVAGNAVCEGGLMIDLSKMKAIQIDVEKQTATAEPGLKWNEFDKATLEHGLATTGGTVSDTGIAGLTVGGGMGWLMGKHGSTCDNVLSVELITADGELLKVDKDNHSDLFWAIRGGGGNFGIISRFEYQLHKVYPNVVAGMILYPMDQAKEVFNFYRTYVTNSPDELMSYSGFIVTPDGIPVTLIMPAWMGDPADAEKHLAPLRNFGTPVADLISEMPYTQLQSMLDAAAPAGLRRYWKSGYFTEISDELLDILLKYLSQRPSPFTPFLFYHNKGAACRIDSSATAFLQRYDRWDGNIISQWTDPADDEKNIKWTRDFWKEIEPFTSGVYVNHLDSDDGSDRVKRAYGKNYEKLLEVKRRYDPTNFFRLNNNINPL